MASKMEDFLRGIVSVVELSGRVFLTREGGETTCLLYHIEDENGHEIASFFRQKGKPLVVKQSKNEQTGGKKPYFFIYDEAIEELEKKGLSSLYFGYLFRLGGCVEMGTGRLRWKKRGKPSMNISDIAKKLGISMNAASRFVSTMRELEIFDKRDKAYWVNRAYLARGLKRGEVEKGQADRTATDSKGVEDS